MAYKIGDKALIIESNGQSVLIVKELSFGVDGTDSAGDFANTAGGSVSKSFTLSEGFVSSYFSDFSKAYFAGGRHGAFGSRTDDIRRIPFATDTVANNIGSLTQETYFAAGHSSSTHGFTSGGDGPGVDPRTIDKFPFASDGDAVDVSDLNYGRENHAGHQSSTDGYTSGGHPPYTSNIVNKFPFSSTSNSTIFNELTVQRYTLAGVSSPTHAYVMGGSTPGGRSNVIDKFQFASSGNGADVGDLTVARSNLADMQSPTHGYGVGGDTPGNSNVIDKFPFSSDANAVDVGDLLTAGYDFSGASGDVHAYIVGNTGTPYATPYSADLDKFPFSTETVSNVNSDFNPTVGSRAGRYSV